MTLAMKIFLTSAFYIAAGSLVFGAVKPYPFTKWKVVFTCTYIFAVLVFTGTFFMLVWG